MVRIFSSAPVIHDLNNLLQNAHKGMFLFVCFLLLGGRLVHFALDLNAENISAKWLPQKMINFCLYKCQCTTTGKSTSLKSSFSIYRIFRSKAIKMPSVFVQVHKSNLNVNLQPTQMHKCLLRLNQELCLEGKHTHIQPTLTNFIPDCSTYTDIFIFCGPHYDPLLPLALNFTKRFPQCSI